MPWDVIQTALIWILGVISENKIIIGLFLTALVRTMPRLLPKKGDFSQWLWTWVRDTGKLFLNFRGKAGSSNDTARQVNKQKPLKLELPIQKKVKKATSGNLPIIAEPQLLNG